MERNNQGRGTRLSFVIFRAVLIEEKALKHWIDNFYGYGSWQTRFWFVGYEESGGDVPEEVAEKPKLLL